MDKKAFLTRLILYIHSLFKTYKSYSNETKKDRISHCTYNNIIESFLVSFSSEIVI